MSFFQGIAMRGYATEATKKFDEMQSRLSRIESGFHTRMNGKSIGGLIGSFIFTLCWLAAYVTASVFLKKVLSDVFVVAFLAAAGLLIVFMFLDIIVNTTYYGKIAGYKGRVMYLKHQISKGKNAISADQEAFMKAKTRGWNLHLNRALSVPAEATAIEATMTNVASLRSGFLNGIKNFFYYVAVVVFTGVGCYALFPTSEKLAEWIFRTDVPFKTMLILNLIALVIILVFEILFARYIWSETDCSVTNVTLFSLLAGPVFFMVLIALGAGLLWLIVKAIGILLPIASLLIGLAILYTSSSGG